MCRTLKLLGVAAILLFLAGPSARADSVYTYTGTDFTLTYNPGVLPAGVAALDGSVTLTTSLGDNFSGTVTPVAFSFSDGATTINQLNASLANDMFYFLTNSSGAIVSWDVELCATAPCFSLPVVSFESISTSLSGTDDYSYYVDGNGNWALAVNVSAPGTWTSPIATPEPSALLLLGSGLVGLIGVRRKKILPPASDS